MTGGWVQRIARRSGYPIGRDRAYRIRHLMIEQHLIPAGLVIRSRRFGSPRPDSGAALAGSPSAKSIISSCSKASSRPAGSTRPSDAAPRSTPAASRSSSVNGRYPPNGGTTGAEGAPYNPEKQALSPKGVATSQLRAAVAASTSRCGTGESAETGSRGVAS